MGEKQVVKEYAINIPRTGTGHDDAKELAQKYGCAGAITFTFEFSGDVVVRCHGGRHGATDSLTARLDVVLREMMELPMTTDVR